MISEMKKDIISGFKATRKFILKIENLGSCLSLILFVVLLVTLPLSLFVHVTLLDSGYPIYIYFGLYFASLICSFIIYKVDLDFKEDLDKILEAIFLKIILLSEEALVILAMVLTALLATTLYILFH